MLLSIVVFMSMKYYVAFLRKISTVVFFLIAIYVNHNIFCSRKLSLFVMSKPEKRNTMSHLARIFHDIFLAIILVQFSACIYERRGSGIEIRGGASQ